MDKSYKRPGVVFNQGRTSVSVWAPAADSVAVLVTDHKAPIRLTAAGLGWWVADTDRIKPGDTYRFLLDGEQELPDPASLKQPTGVHGPSEVVDLESIRPGDAGWTGIALDDYLIYEIHTGTFSPEGTFDGIIAKLDRLTELGITAIELMPVAAFPGERNWGYDGVFPYAALAAYGGPEGLSGLVAAAHAKGLSVILDVIYNHLGPEGNYLSAYGPYFTDKYKTPWGSAINYDDAGCDAVRQYVISNALMWLRDFHIDALRLDAVHAIKDFSVKHILQEMREAVDALENETGRSYYLIIENDLNDPRFIRDGGSGGYGMDGQWIDEFHHALRVASGQPRTGYYSDFNGLEHLAKSFRDAYVYDGQYSPHRDRHFGAPAAGAAGRQFVVFSQNHDQTGNRMLGERTSTLLSMAMQRVLAAAVILSPFIPLLFMGEEWSEPAPFQYFISHSDPELIEAVRQGRREEFKDFHAAGSAPDPQDAETFLRCKLDWTLPGKEPHAAMLRYYKELISLRKTHPALRPDRSALKSSTADTESGILEVIRERDGKRLVCLFNFSKEARNRNIPEGARLLLNSADPDRGGLRTSNHNSGSENIRIEAESCTIYESDL